MKYIALNLTALSPLAIRADHAPGGAATAPYIAGATLAGSLAAVYRLYYPTQIADFERLFLSGQIQYPNLYPATFQHKEAQKAVALPVYPVPKTAQSCKRFPGFTHDVDEDSPHGVRDSLFDWAVFELGGRKHAALKSLLAHKACEYKPCDKAMHHFDGFYRRLNNGQSKPLLAKAKVATRLQTHTGINRATGTVQEGILYSRQVFEEKARFSGVVKFPDQGLADAFEKFIEQVGETGLVRIGNGRTRGMGKVELTTQTPEERFEFAAFQKRLAGFDNALRQQAQKALEGQELAPFYFALTLHSPAILRDPLLRYRGSIDEQTLQGLTDLPDGSFKLIYQAAGVQQVTGWNELWGTPRMSEYAIESGSVFLFEYSGKANEDLDRALFNLEEKGIGQRRGEGFGRVCISDPFHLEAKQR